MELINQFSGAKGDTPYTRSLFKSFLCLAAEMSSTVSETDLSHTVQQYLYAHTRKTISAAQMAAELGYHPNYLNRVFKSSTGTTMRQYQLDLKIRKAMDMISHTDFTLRFIAQECGFDDQNYFSRLFRKRTGMSPTAFRQRHLSENQGTIVHTKHESINKASGG